MLQRELRNCDSILLPQAFTRFHAPVEKMTTIEAVESSTARGLVSRLGKAPNKTRLAIGQML
jgi:hypothetical protein